MPRNKERSGGEEGLKVFIRVRPPILQEVALTNAVSASGNHISVCGDKHDVNCTYDKVFNELTDQTSVFHHVQPVMDGILKGINGCVFAYGQTSAGKSYTMLGPQGGQDILRMDESKWGVLPRAAEYLLGTLAEMAEDGLCSYTVKAQFLQIYNESLCDLLRAPSDSLYPGASEPSLKIREVPSDMSADEAGVNSPHEVYVAGLSEYRVHTAADVLQLLHRGTTARVTSATEYNQTSSRSHAVLQLNFEITHTGSVGQERTMTKSKLSLVDLAGSEKMSVTTSGLPIIQGDLIEICSQLEEARHVRELSSINKSLSALGNVIQALSSQAQEQALFHKKRDIGMSSSQIPVPNRHIPYRDSKLTRLLQDSLGGNTRTVLIACVAPTSLHASETISTLGFADRASRVLMSRVRANVLTLGSGYGGGGIEGYKIALDRANAEIERLKGLLTMAMSGSSVSGGMTSGIAIDTQGRADRESAGAGRADDEGVVRRLRQDNQRLRLENEALRSNSNNRMHSASNAQNHGSIATHTGSTSHRRTTSPYTSTSAPAVARPSLAPLSLAEFNASASNGNNNAFIAVDRRLSREGQQVQKLLQSEAARLKAITEEKKALQQMLALKNPNTIELDYTSSSSVSPPKPNRYRAISPISPAPSAAPNSNEPPRDTERDGGIAGGGSKAAMMRMSVQAASQTMHIGSPKNVHPQALVSTKLSPSRNTDSNGNLSNASSASSAAAKNHFAQSIARLKAQAEREKERRRAFGEAKIVTESLALSPRSGISDLDSSRPALSTQPPLITFTQQDKGASLQIFSFRRNEWETVSILDVGEDPKGVTMHKIMLEGAQQGVWTDLRRKPVREAIQE